MLTFGTHAYIISISIIRYRDVFYTVIVEIKLRRVFYELFSV